MEECMVCKNMTDNCPPSPFLPYSGWRCLECVKAHRIPYEDLLGIIHSHGSNSYESAVRGFAEWFGEDGYAEKYWLPTLEFFGKSKEEVLEESKCIIQN